MIADFWKPFLFRYAPLQRLPKIIVLYFDLIFFFFWVTSIYNADDGYMRELMPFILEKVVPASSEVLRNEDMALYFYNGKLNVPKFIHISTYLSTRQNN